MATTTTAMEKIHMQNRFYGRIGGGCLDGNRMQNHSAIAK